MNLNYDNAYTSIKGYNHAVTDDGRAACGLSGYRTINRTYKYNGNWTDKTENKCGLCQRSLDKQQKETK